MSCGACTCGCGCNVGCGCRVIVLPENPVEEYFMVNINTLGIGVYDSTEGTTFQMRGIYSANASLTVALDAENNAIVLTFDVESIIDDLPQATTTQRGVGETATDAEAIAKASTTVFVTPSNFAAMDASTTFKGFIEIATNAEAIAGASALLAITPASLAAVLTSVQGNTVTFADAPARAADTPNFIGQFGAQQDTGSAWVGTALSAGSWQQLWGFGQYIITTASTGVQLDTNAEVLFTTGDTTGLVTFNGVSVAFNNSSTLNLQSVDLEIAGVQVPASSVLGTAAGGVPTSRLLNTFLSNSNTTVWGAPSGTLARTILASYAGQNISNPPTEAEVQTLDDAVVAISQHLCALITDLRATLKPHAT